MDILSIFLLVIFIIVSLLLIMLVLIQSEEGDSLGGVFAGGSGSAFGSRSGNVLTKASSILGVLFFVLSFSLALLNRTPLDDKGVEEAGRQALPAQTNDLKDYAPPSDTSMNNALPEDFNQINNSSALQSDEESVKNTQEQNAQN
ncbi:MAG: preprotein translocase subunit SecG [Spirochaetaceae bacterium]|jgi:preprotein translocase subunit SecG|nr:preprotein translocase subunit SecG [Spirochaetaceae bacterium]